MGYVNVTDITKFIPPSKILKTAGTWTPAISSNVISEARGAADEAVTLLIPVDLEGADVALQGAKLQSVDIWYKIATAAERKAVGDHKMTVTLSTPAFLEDNEAIWLSLVIDCAATTVLTIFGAQANFDLRL
jgi:hypothetical protein